MAASSAWMTLPCSATSTLTWKNASPGISPCCGTGSGSRSHGIGEAQLGAKDVVGIDFDADPVALHRLGHLTGHIAAGERVEDDLARFGQEANKELGQSRGKAGGMDGQARLATANKVII